MDEEALGVFLQLDVTISNLHLDNWNFGICSISTNDVLGILHGCKCFLIANIILIKLCAYCIKTRYLVCR